MKNLPNILTFLRIFILPFLVFIFYLPFHWSHWVASLIFAFASFTDWLDGYLARSLKLSTKLGAFLDPVADKLMVSMVLILIVGERYLQTIQIFSMEYTIHIAVITIPAAIIVSREIVVSALREWMAEIGKRASVAVSRLGKFKTAVQMIALIILLSCTASTSGWIILLGYIFIYIAAILTLWSMAVYLKVVWPELKKQ